MAKQIVRTREQLIKAQAEFHLKQSRLPYIEKMKIVDMLMANPFVSGGPGAKVENSGSQAGTPVPPVEAKLKTTGRAG